MASSPQSTLTSADSDIEAPPVPNHANPATGSKRAASIAFSDLSPTSSHPRRRPPAPQALSSANINILNLNSNNDFDDPPHTHQHATSYSDISSDTSGSVPGSPRDHHNDDGEFAEQVTVCRWASCNEDCGNMDNLVKHIHDDHIGSRKAKYACEWDDCTRKGMTHASGYALRAHMRSHTREKPFYCSLPECDRSFTRSDALAKHMRTVHETEALRPSDPIPKSHPNHPQNIANAYTDALLRRQSRSAPSVTAGAANGGGFKVLNAQTQTSGYGNVNRVGLEEIGSAIGTVAVAPPTLPPPAAVKAGTKAPGNVKMPQENSGKSYYSATDPFSPVDETFRPPKELYKYLKQKLKWAQEEHGVLEQTLQWYVKKRREAWIKKELLLEKCLQMELGDDGVKAVSIFWEKGDGKRAGDAGPPQDVADAEDADAEDEVMRDLNADIDEDMDVDADADADAEGDEDDHQSEEEGDDSPR